MQCTNQVKQLTLAAHTFHDAKKRLPCGVNDPLWLSYRKADSKTPAKPNGDRIDAVDVYSFLVSSLPFIEQTALYEVVTSQCSLAASISPYPSNPYDYIPCPWDTNPKLKPSVNATDDQRIIDPFARNVPVFGCPSDANAQKPDSQTNWHGPTSYHGNRGDALTGAFWGETRGIFPEGNNGGKIGLEMSDGTSNTIYISEGCASTPGGDQRVRSGIANDGSIPSRLAGIPTNCAEKRGPNGMLIGSVYDSKGRRWCDGRNAYTLFQTVLPPNSPSCRGNGNNSESEPLISASSYHTGGVNVGLCDGSVTFVSDTIDCGRLNEYLGQSLGNTKASDPHQWTGPTTYGVWGALGSSHAGDQVGSF